MTVQPAAPSRGGKSVGAAAVGAALTLAIFVLVFVSFLLAPLALLLVAFLAWTVMKPRQGSGSNGPAPQGSTGADGTAPTADGFGTGVR